MPDPELLSFADVAEIVGRHPRTVRRWVADGHIPAVHIGPVTFIRRDDLDHVLASS